MSDAETGSQVEEKPTGRVIPFSGKLTVADVYAAIALMEPRSTKVKRWCLAIFGATLFCFFGWLSLHRLELGDRIGARMAFTGAAAPALLAAAFFTREWWYRRRAQQLYEEGTYLYSRTEGEITETSIHSRTENGEGIMHWNGFLGYRDGGEVIVLIYKEGPSYVYFARTKFASDDDWEAFRQLMHEKLQAC